MSSVFRSLFILILVMAIGSYLFYLRTGSLPTSPRIFSSGMNAGSPDLKRLSEMPSLNSVEPPDDMTTIQKWQDENGQWVFSNQKTE
ncbi:MAG: hypothetical protein QNK32_05525 [Porticoccus sp.]|nr:hypothetical protein [Porticoccus sp.]